MENDMILGRFRWWKSRNRTVDYGAVFAALGASLGQPTSGCYQWKRLSNYKGALCFVHVPTGPIWIISISRMRTLNLDLTV